MNQPEIHYRNQKFFLQIEGESVEISNPDVITSMPDYGNHITKTARYTEDGDSFPLHSGIGYRISCCPQCIYVQGGKESPECCHNEMATLYVIEEEKEPEIPTFESLQYNWGNSKCGRSIERYVYDILTEKLKK